MTGLGTVKTLLSRAEPPHTPRTGEPRARLYALRTVGIRTELLVASRAPKRADRLITRPIAVRGDASHNPPWGISGLPARDGVHRGGGPSSERQASLSELVDAREGRLSTLRVDTIRDVGSEKLPAESSGAMSDDLRQRGIDFVQRLLATGEVDLERFHSALDELFQARTEADVASVVRSLPAPVVLTAPSRRRLQPYEIETSMNGVRLEGRWQVGSVTSIESDMGSVTVDMTEAEFDDLDVDLVVKTRMGAVTIIVPRGFDVRLVGRNGAVNVALDPPVPGFPVVRLSATSDMGAVRVVHPKEKKDKSKRRRGWPRRRSARLP
ncbi:MAG: hypothetical protein JWM85_2513 [Acidimicrobiaceae bacterium]|nr:hypothetical protein [Acidimicrobiaceae bacterium]